MLLPSDVARLVLGYLQEEGLSGTSQAFIHESPNLREYADHTIGDGTIPACLFSVFGKSLTTILNEYVATKTKESCHEVPVVMTSLWKKLDFTLNQIKSLQNSPAVSACQRTRSRVAVANMARQRVLTVASAGAVVCSSVSEISPVISPSNTSHSVVTHSTPASYTAPHNRPAISSGAHQQILDVRLNTPVDSPMSVSEQRLNLGPASPGRRKWKRGGMVNGSGVPGRYTTNASSLTAESQLEQEVDENFPQLVIQNARDKILGDRSLQEKLAENINKILASDPVPQTSKASSSAVEAEQSIDEILGLQGEIHMSDDAIHDILEQTESDPAFQALYDLFDYNKTRFTDGESEIVSSSPEENDTAGSSSPVRPFQSNEPGKSGQERKTRKSNAPTLLKKTVLASNSRTSRIENCSARLLMTHRDQQGASSAPLDSSRTEKDSLTNNSIFVEPMELDEPLNTPPPTSDSTTDLDPAFKDSASTTTTQTEPSAVPSLTASPASTASGTTAASNVDKNQGHRHTEGSRESPAAAPLSQSNQPTVLSPALVELNGAATASDDLPQMPISSSGGNTQPVLTILAPTESDFTTSVSTAAPFTATPASPTSASTSTTRTATPASSMPNSPSPLISCVPLGAMPDPSTTVHTSPSKAAADSNVVSLKIIISDNHTEESSSDPVLKQAISSISGENIPTIFLSSPAKSPIVPGTPKTNLDEAAQAVSGLQVSDVHASPLSSKTGALVASPLIGASQIQQNYIIQLPLDASTPALQGATTSYFLVTETPTKDAQPRQVFLSTGVSKGQPLPVNQYGVATPTSSQGYTAGAGSALLLPSPVKPMILPVSVMGQNTLGKLPVVSNQLVAIPTVIPSQQSETVSPKSPTRANKLKTTAGTDQLLVGNLVQPVSASNSDKQDAAKGFKHKRILCFDSSSEVQPQTTKTTTTSSPATNTATSQSVQQTVKDNTQSSTRTKPAILGGNKPKRRIQTIKCSVDPQTDRNITKETQNPVSPKQQQKEPAKKNSRKDHSIHYKVSQSGSNNRVEAPQPGTSKKSGSGRRSKSVDRKQSHKDGGAAKTKESHSSRSLSADSTLKASTRKDKEEKNNEELAEKAPSKSREGRTEKRAPSQGMPNVTANKENEIKGSVPEQQQQPASSSSTSRDFSPPSVTQPASNHQSKAPKTPSKTSSLAKQAAEMLHDIQGLNPASTPTKRSAEGGSDPSLPRTTGSNHNQEPTECPRTPSRQKKCKDGEGTPKNRMLPNLSDAPTCSPASEAGSENSINMAAHTLMILSRAAIARTGTPLKDSLRQEGVGERSPTKSKKPEKRKLSSPTSSPPAKKDRERKKLVDCFPRDLDVDKFLSSLHYDE
ncbi:protein NPAT [Antennarius striatus]|uniref:protein NPAT n=1 Tax=Antennarius striatus TaxID=241820 RepID=UPI0035B3776D